MKIFGHRNDIVDRARAALEGVTEGPWTWDGDSFSDQPGNCPHETDWCNHGPDLMSPEIAVITVWGYDAAGIFVKTADAEFITAARTLIPELVAEIEKLRRS